MKEYYSMEDTLSHYYRKLHELNDEVLSLKTKLQDARGIVEESWRGLSGEACERQLEQSKDELGRVENKLSDAILALSNIDVEGGNV
ncbi:MAG: hypothetical protein K6E26_10635 [Clostridiales bacterium]|nr:hypothetical protein [Clostridiales bacterium]MBR6254648.1 hypothetical protein [Clostridiales bacterium]MCR5275798.1 hypothetical protein [Clostridiales bacterium]